MIAGSLNLVRLAQRPALRSSIQFARQYHERVSVLFVVYLPKTYKLFYRSLIIMKSLVMLVQ